MNTDVVGCNSCVCTLDTDNGVGDSGDICVVIVVRGELALFSLAGCGADAFCGDSGKSFAGVSGSGCVVGASVIGCLRGNRDGWRN